MGPARGGGTVRAPPQALTRPHTAVGSLRLESKLQNFRIRTIIKTISAIMKPHGTVSSAPSHLVMPALTVTPLRRPTVRAAVAAAEVRRPGTRMTVTYIPSECMRL